MHAIKGREIQEKVTAASLWGVTCTQIGAYTYMYSIWSHCVQSAEFVAVGSHKTHRRTAARSVVPPAPNTSYSDFLFTLVSEFWGLKPNTFWFWKKPKHSDINGITLTTVATCHPLCLTCANQFTTPNHYVEVLIISSMY